MDKVTDSKNPRIQSMHLATTTKEVDLLHDTETTWITVHFFMYFEFYVTVVNTIKQWWLVAEFL